ncbi:hypothetical protein B0H13DRAFT_1868517 [Mycena leptocephala]|nr:hypothetical protein B0H13DRAFT_1868517 [Mycena leptocephala]
MATLMLLLPPIPSLSRFAVHVAGLESDLLLDVLSHMLELKLLTILEEPRFQLRALVYSRRWTFLRAPYAVSKVRPVLCPRLETVELPNFRAVSDETFLRFVQSRTEPQHQSVAQLSRVAARFSRPMDLDIKSHLQDAIGGGLDITPIYTPSPVTYSPLEGTNDFLPGWEEWRERGWRTHHS